MGYGDRSANHRNSKENPGPGSYDVTKSTVIKRDQPMYSIGKGKRESIQYKSMVKNPGPGDYSLPSKFVESAKYSFGIRHVDFDKSKNLMKSPGPGEYSPEKPKPDSKFSFGRRLDRHTVTNHRNPMDFELRDESKPISAHEV